MSSAPILAPQQSTHVETQVLVRERTRVDRRTKSQESSAPSVRKSTFVQTLPAQFGVFVVMTVLACVISSIWGSAQADQARRSINASAQSAKEARADMSRLRRTVDTEMSDLSVERWAKANGFVPLHGWMEEEEQVERIQ